jgi:hypothetical protein
MDCISSFSDTRADSSSRRLIIAKTVSVLEVLPTSTLIELLCEISRLCPEEGWSGQVRDRAQGSLRLHHPGAQAD